MTEEGLRAGRYQIVGKLGEGAQGTTFDAVDGKDGRAVAIKRFEVRGAKSWKDVELAEREATVLESLSHPALPAFIEHFEENGALFLVMQKMEGQSLAQLIARGGSLSREDVYRFLSDASSVLTYLHGRSPPVIHRDINPKNVIRRPDGSFALVDFGAVRDRLKPEGGSTVVGTFGYMGPEQFQGRAVPASDVYAVGATALRLLTGVDPEKLPHKGLAVDVRAALGQGADPAFREVLERMLDPDPDRRASSLAPLLKRLSAYAPRSADSGARSERAGASDDRKEREQRRDQRRERERDEARERHAARHEREREEREEHRRHDRARRDARWQWEEDGWPWEQEGWPWEQEGWSWHGERQRVREEYRERREEYRERRREFRQRAKEARRQRRRGQRSARPLHGAPLAFAIFGLEMAILTVGLVVGLFVPMLLVFLSIFFGPSLSNAARRVRNASHEARENMRNFRTYLIKGPGPEADAAAPEEAEPAAPRVRVDEPPQPDEHPRVRVTETDEGDVIDTTATEVPDDAAHRQRQ